MGSNYSSTYNVDIAMCIDATGSMGPFIDSVKKNALTFYQDLMAKLAEKNKHVNELRVRLIVFRDYLADGENAMRVTDFFTLPAQNAQFAQAVNSITVDGGGDDQEDGLEALAYAIRSKWNRSEGKKRHIIVLWTDDGAHEIGFGKRSPFYPAGMPNDFKELSAWWGVGQGHYAGPGSDKVMDRQSKRILIFAPSKEPWATIAKAWDNTLYFPAAAGEGLKEKTYSFILSTISESV